MGVDACRSMGTVDNPTAVVTCGFDKTVAVWDFDGACLGQLDTHDNFSQSVSVRSEWHPAPCQLILMHSAIGLNKAQKPSHGRRSPRGPSKSTRSASSSIVCGAVRLACTPSAGPLV